MATLTVHTQTRNQLAGSYDISTYFLGGNERIRLNYTASGETTLAAGLVMAKVAATGVLAALDPTASDGTQFPIGVLDLGIHDSITIEDGETVQLTLVNKGRVANSKLSYPTGELLRISR